ncbi:MAG: hypothetical protein FWG90_03695 [Oscillospiraceae bacterium]|nr:hypothetical protein [Oscillospiraceae bacterium]
MAVQKFLLKTGVQDLVYAPVVKDDKEGFETGVPKQLVFVASLSKSKEINVEAIHYDNKEMRKLVSEGDVETSIDSSVLPLHVKAELEGKLIDEDTGAVLDNGVGRAVYFAVGYKAKYYDNEDKEQFLYVWHAKGTFDVTEEEYNTEEGTDTEKTGQSFTYHSMRTVHEFDFKGEKHTGKVITADSASGLIDEDKFFAQVMTPENIGTAKSLI